MKKQQRKLEEEKKRIEYEMHKKEEEKRTKAEVESTTKRKGEVFNKHKKRLGDEETRMDKDLIIKIKKCPSMDGLLEVTDKEQILKLTQGYVRRYVWRYEDEKKILYVPPPFYYEKEK